MNKMTLEQVSNIPIGELSEFTADQLISLQSQATENLDKAKRLKEWIDSAITLKYQNQALSARNSQSKSTGTIHFNDGNFKVTSIVSKKIEWDQAKLKEAVSEIKESGDNIEEYVAISYKVSEAKYNAWPEHIKKFFRSARLLKLGKENFKIELIKEVSHE
jgi:hypothetical protein